MIAIIRDDRETTAHGDPIPTTGDPVEIPGAIVAPRVEPSVEGVTGPGRQGVVVGLTLYVPPDSPHPRRTDHVDVDGELYDVDGEPGVWRSPHMNEVRGIEIALRRAAG